MRSRYILFLALALALHAQGAGVSQSQAKSVARAWTHTGKVFGTAVDSTVKSAQTFAVTNDFVLHAVTMKDGRTVFVSGDLALEPIVAFSSSKPAADSPLVDILRRDAYLRARQAGLFDVATPAATPKVRASRTLALAAAAGTATSTSASVVPDPEIARKWAALLPDDTATSSSSTSSSDPSVTTEAENSYTEDQVADPNMGFDIRVEPLLKTRWSQTTAYSLNCYNYYTPGNYPCGCTATAISQIMRYFEYPSVMPSTAFVPYQCEVNGAVQSLSPIADPDDSSKPKAYSWSDMAYTPATGVTVTQCEAIGHLTYDVGVVLRSEYTAEGTGASPSDAGRVFGTFGYPNGFVYYNDEGLDEYYSTQKINVSDVSLTGSEDLRQRVILASLDAKIPVFMGIYGFDKRSGQLTWNWAGHAVVADGYATLDVEGEETTYVHVNLGWGGFDDAWYNIPTIFTKETGATGSNTDGTAYQLLTAASFNVSPDSACAGKELVTGRIVDDDGEPVADAVVTAFDESGDVVSTTTSDSHGIYYFWLTGGKSYDIEAESADGSLGGSLDDPVTPGTSAADGNNLVDDPSHVGNIWGVDIVISSPCVRIGDIYYTNLNRALEASTTNDVLEVVLPAKFKSAFTIDHDVTILATNEDAYASMVTCRSGATLTVSNGVTVTFTNIVFSSSETVVNVQSNGAVRVSGVAVFDDLCSDVPGIVTAMDSGFVLEGELLTGITLECAAAPNAGDRFGLYACDTAVAKACANRIISLNGEDRAGAWDSEITTNVGYLKWIDDAEVAPEVALVSLDVDGSMSYYRKLDKLFAKGANTNGTVVATLLRVKAPLTNSWTLATSSTADWTFCSTLDGTVNFGKKASLTFVSDVSMTCTDIAFAGPSMSTYTPFTVCSNAVLTLDSGAMVTNFSYAAAKHVVDVNNGGRFVMNDGSSILSCNMGGTTGYGTVNLAAGSTFDFTGGEIFGCSVGKGGGAVYVAAKSTLNISGSATAYGNTERSSCTTNDVYLANTNAILNLVGAIDASDGIGITGNGAVIKEGAVFGTVDSSALTEDDIFVARHLIYNEANTALYPTVTNDTQLIWTTEVPFPMAVDESEAVASVSFSSTTNFYATLSDAFRAATNENATITLLVDVDFKESVEVLADGLVLDGGTNSVYYSPNYLNRSESDTACIAVSNKTFTMRNIGVQGGSGRVVDAYKANVTLDDGVVISDVAGSDKGYLAPVVVWGGTFTMNNGAVIVACTNSYQRLPGGPLCAGGIVVNGESEAGTATAYLNGGIVALCSSPLAGGIYIGNGATVEVQGDLRVYYNTTNAATGVDCNLYLNDNSQLTLVGEFTGSVGISEGVNADTNAFGKVASSLTTEVATNSAACFFHDSDGATGKVNTDGKTLVWTVTSGGGGGGGGDDPEVVQPDPIAFQSITKTSDGWELVITNRVPYCWYRLIWTEDLNTGFSVTGEWEQASSAGAWTTNIVTTTDAFFWKAEAMEGEVTE